MVDRAKCILIERQNYSEMEAHRYIEKAAMECAPSLIARYLLSLAQSFNKFYSLEKINALNENVRNSNFALAKAIRIVINEGLRLLGISYVDEM